jgi:hypothetical protein
MNRIIQWGFAKMKKRMLIFAVIISLLASSFLYGCRADTDEATKDSILEAILGQDDPIEMMKSVVRITEDSLSGIWINEFGFVCSYSDGVFIDNTGIEYADCKITEDGISGVSDQFEEEIVHIGIRIFADDTLEVNERIAVKAYSETGKQYLALLRSQLEGDWFSCDGSDASYESYNHFEDGKISVISTEGEEIGDSNSDSSNLSYGYTFENGILTLCICVNDSEIFENYYLQMKEDVMSLFCYGIRVNLYRKGSQAAEDAQSGKSLVTGDWIFVSSDNSEIAKWLFDGDETLSIKGYGNREGKNSRKYSVSRQNDEIMLVIDGKEYVIGILYSSDGYYIGIYDDEECYGELYSANSQDGLNYIEKAKTIYSLGEMKSRNFSQKSSVPEISSVSLTLDCMSNLWLQDSITVIEDSSIENTDFVCGATYEINCSEKLKNASVTFTYNPDQLPYDDEEALSIAYKDSQTESFKLMPTTIDSVHCTATAAITNVGTYALVDSFVFEGGKRDISELDPSSTSWARNCDTGDILSLIDLDYIQKSEGCFYVTNASELASAVYYVNTSDATYFDYSVTFISIENDIDLSNYEWAPMGWSDTTEEHPFYGQLSGNFHTINGLTIDSNDDDVGLIGWGLGSVADLSLTNASVSGSSNVGVLAGQAILGNYSNCHADGSVQGSSAGSLLGYEANVTLKNCSANVLVNGEQFDFLSWNEKEKSEIIIEDPVTITIDAEYTVTRPDVTGYQNLGWTVIYNGEVVLERLAENEYSYQYFSTDPGTYEIYLSAYVSGQYVPISNTLSYTIR